VSKNRYLRLVGIAAAFDKVDMTIVFR